MGTQHDAETYLQAVSPVLQLAGMTQNLLTQYRYIRMSHRLGGLTTNRQFYYYLACMLPECTCIELKQ